MAKTDVIMPQMGESIAEGTITKWLKQPGDSVRRDEPLFEISTDKVDAEIPSPAAGVLAEIKVGEGETVEVNTVVAAIADSADEVSDASGDKPAKSDDGDKSDNGDKPAKSDGGGTPARADGSDGDRAQEKQPAAATAGAGARTATADASKDELRRTRSTPLVRRIAAEKGIDISQIQGTGISGRVTKQDLLEYIEAGGPAVSPTRQREAPAEPSAPATPSAPAPAAAPSGAPSSYRSPTGPTILPPSPTFPPDASEVVEPMSTMRKKIAEHMVHSKRTSAHVHSIYEIDCSNIMNTRAAVQREFVQRHGQKLTVTPFFVKAAVEALRAIPLLNASIDGDNIVYKKSINIGVAVALEWGLIVPVIHNADELSLVGINKRVADLANRARNKQLKPEEVQGGTFTITNPGIFGSMFGTPVINQPQVAILGMGMVEKRVRVTKDDAIVIKPMMYSCISYDHRLVDGAVADQWMIHLKHTLETADFKALL